MAADGRELWERISRGGTGALDSFYRCSAPRLMGFLFQMTRSRQAAQDIVQESFLQLWRRPNGYQPEKRSLRSYLFGIGRKRTAERRRKNTPGAEAKAEQGTTAAREPSSLMTDALSRLDAEQRAVLWLRDAEGQSYAELAEVPEIPMGP